eukprot:tig00001234_g7749.t1
MIVMAIQTDKKVAEGTRRAPRPAPPRAAAVDAAAQAFSAIDIVSLAVYFTEAALKAAPPARAAPPLAPTPLAALRRPRGYWKSGYNVFVRGAGGAGGRRAGAGGEGAGRGRRLHHLVLSIFDLVQLLAPGLLASVRPPPRRPAPPALRGGRSERQVPAGGAGPARLRALRGISFIEPLQVFMLAIVRTMKSAANLLLLLFLLMYVYAIVAFNFFGRRPRRGAGGVDDAAGLPADALDMVTADNWSSFTNLDQAQEEESRRQTERKRRLRAKKLSSSPTSRRRGPAPLRHQETATQRIDDLVQRTVHAMRHDDIVPMTSLACNPVWMQTLAMTLEHHRPHVPQPGLHFEARPPPALPPPSRTSDAPQVARTLGEIVMRRLRAARVADGYATRTVAEVVERVKAMAAPSGPACPARALPAGKAHAVISVVADGGSSSSRSSSRTAPPVRPPHPGPAPEAEAEAAAVAAAARGRCAGRDGTRADRLTWRSSMGCAPRGRRRCGRGAAPASRPAAPARSRPPGAPTPS